MRPFVPGLCLALGCVPLWTQSLPVSSPDLSRQKDYIFPNPATLRQRAQAVSVLSSNPDGSEVVQYTAFDGTSYTLTRFTGKYVALLLSDTWLSGLSVAERRIFLERADLLYQEYVDLLGAQPGGSGVTTIAIVSTCGFGCGYVGARGIEIAPDTGALGFVKEDLDLGHVPDVLTHEMGHNFDLYSWYLEYSPVDSHAWTDLVQPFIKVFDRE